MKDKENKQKEIELEDLEQVTGGSIKNTTKKETEPISPDTKENI